MNFRVGDAVIHWAHGLGEIIRLEEQTIGEEKKLYYVVQIRDLTVWVPADEETDGRLRTPTPKNEFKKLFAILGAPGEPLPDDRLERKTQLHDALRDGRAESLCRLVRDLSWQQTRRPLNDHDKDILKRALDRLLGEWGFSLSVPVPQAAKELRRMLHQA